ncbi:hypothetical protein [Metamycoplasma orale]|uniref:hypothetical protein n=1 Tax=Metamycoplasma orale TaxID=2121 RepID=UPI00101DF56F|nr:hypothetical protein [Metamycoplasma orale]
MPKYETLQSDVTELKKLIEESKKVLSSKKSANELKVQFEKLVKMVGSVYNKKLQIDNRIQHLIILMHLIHYLLLVIN